MRRSKPYGVLKIGGAGLLNIQSCRGSPVLTSPPASLSVIVLFRDFPPPINGAKHLLTAYSSIATR